MVFVQTLYLHGNKLRVIPPTLMTLTNLQHLVINDNPLVPPFNLLPRRGNVIEKIRELMMACTNRWQHE